MYWNYLKDENFKLECYFNLYMRCIETKHPELFISFEKGFNLYMRCIETQEN